MASDSGGLPPLTINTEDHLPIADDLSATSNRNLSANIASTTSTPLPSAPGTPAPTRTARRTSQPAISPRPNPPSRPQSSLQRTSSAASFHQRPPSSPVLKKNGSRSSLGAQPEDGGQRPTPKRSISNLIAGLRDTRSAMEAIEEPVPLTAPDIAMSHFTRELGMHTQASTAAETVVIVHDACYGHRFSRSKTTKTMLSLIVERPERILASVLGISVAYVRLGEHHSGGKNAPHPNRLEPSRPPFRIRRTDRTLDIMAPYVTAIHGSSWMTELQVMCELAGGRVASGLKELERPCTPEPEDTRHFHEGDLYLCSESLNAFQGALGGVADAVDAVFAPTSEVKHAFVAVRPPGHHCSADFPSGFCWLNNVHVGIEYAAQVYGLTHAAIVDFDLHHGDGSQSIAWERNSKNNIKRVNAKSNSKLKLTPDIGYYSLHDINSYPCENGDDEKVQAASLCIEDAHGQNVWNVHLQPWKTEAEFWQLYESRYLVLLEKAKIFLERQTARLRAEGKIRPKAAIFISAGFDASEWEGSGMQRHKVNVPTEFYARFTRDMVNLAHQDASGCDGRVISVLEGGYSDRALCSGVLSHVSGLCTNSPESKESAGPAGLDQLMRGLAINGSSVSADYNRVWWSTENLTALEMRVNPPPPPALGKKGRASQPTYATPTESFAYKVVDTDKFARSVSGTMRDSVKPVRPPTPPPPEVDWVTATHELSKLLVPADRQTKSCTAEELGGVRVKKEPQTSTSVLSPVDIANPRQLRDRRAKTPVHPESRNDSLDVLQSVNRRQTIADIPSMPSEPPQQRRASRRLSAGSTLGMASSEIDPSAPPIPALPPTRVTPNGAMKPLTRPESSLQVKKARAPPKSTRTSVIGASVPASASRAKPTTATSDSTRPTTSATNKDMEALTSGFKKVTLKVGTREEHDRKQKEKLDAERRARALKGAETRKANAAAKKAALTSTGPPPALKTAAQVIENGKERQGAAAPASMSTDTTLSAEPPPSTLSNAIVDTQQLPPPPSGSMLTTQSVASVLDLQSPSVLTTQSAESATANDIHGATKLEAAHSMNASLASVAPLKPAMVERSTANRPSGLPIPSQILASSRPAVAAPFTNGSPISNSTPMSPPASSPIRPTSREDLPVWSSTGTIPFAPNSNAAASTIPNTNGIHAQDTASGTLLQPHGTLINGDNGTNFPPDADPDSGR